MDWEARMSMRTWTKQVLAEAEAITRDPNPEPQPAPMGGVVFEYQAYNIWIATHDGPMA